MPQPRRLLVLAAAAFLAPAAPAQSLLLLNAFAVDRAGTTLVDIGGARLIDGRGQVSLCGQATVAQAVARLDAPGFLVRLSQGSLPPIVQVEQWSGQGAVEWQVDGEFFSSVAPVPGGGAVISRQRVGETPIEFQRLDARGNERWRNRAVSGGPPPSYLDHTVDDRERTLFTFPLASGGGHSQVVVGMLDADGNLAWRQDEVRDGFSIPVLLNDRNGDFWWYQGDTATANTTVPSALLRLTPWGLPLSARTGPALAPGREIARPVAGAQDTLWYLAEKRDAEIDLGRLTPAGRLGRFPTGHRLITQLVADGDGAWLAAYTGLHEFTIEHYSAAGRQWARTIGGLRDVRLKVQPAGDLRLLALEDDGISVRRIDRSTGHVVWRKGRAAMDGDCAALADAP